MSLILIVDDHHDTCRLLARLVRTLGWEAEAVQSGPAALEFLRRSPAPPSLVLLDVMMPGMDGFDTLLQIRRTPGANAIPVVMVSAMSGQEYRERAVELGAAEYWVKGAFDPASFVDMLARVVLTSRGKSDTGAIQA